MQFIALDWPYRSASFLNPVFVVWARLISDQATPSGNCAAWCPEEERKIIQTELGGVVGRGGVKDEWVEEELEEKRG